MKRFLSKYAPLWALIPVAACYILQTLLYYGTKLLAEGKYHYSPALPLDYELPLIPVFVIAYVLSYPYWGLSYLYIARTGRDMTKRLIAADVTMKLICAAFFIWYPTTIVRPEIAGEGLCQFFLRLVYAVDSPVNLFPSLHVAMSWLCWRPLGLVGDAPRWLKVSSFVFVVLVMFSTVFTKQHFIIDVPAGAVLGELSYQVGYRMLPRVFPRLFAARGAAK